MLNRHPTRILLVVLPILLVTFALAQDEVPTKKPVPDAAAQAQALKLVKEVYGDEYAKAKTADQKVALAKKLLQKANETRNDPNALYALLNVAKDMAVLAANADTAFAAVDALAQSFEVNPLELKTEALIAASKKARLPAEHGAIAKHALAVMESALATDGYDLANKVGELGLAEARLAPQAKMIQPILARLKESKDLATAYESMRKADAILETTPTDPDANLTVGKYLCLVKGDWDRGISYLALGNEEKLKALAAKELQGVPDADGQVALGDGWWDLAAANEGVAQKQLQGRAAYWYRKALPSLSGLVKDKVEKRVDKGQPEEQPHPSNAKTSVPKQIVKAQRSKSPAHSKWYRFIDETAIRSDWTLTHGWRIEGEGLRLLNERGTSGGGQLVSSDQYTGDFILDVALKETHPHFYTDVVFGLCGEDMKIRMESSEVIRLQRTGDTLLLGRAGRPTTQIKIKQTHLDKPTRLRIQLVWQWGSGGGFWVTAVGFIGSNEPLR